jgi:hypothetical protein
MASVVSRGPFAMLGGVVESNPDFDRHAGNHEACLSVTDGRPPRLYVRTTITQETLDRLEAWAAQRVERARQQGFEQEWEVGILSDGRLCAELWAQRIQPSL